MANKWNMIIDVANCDNCRVCFLADKDEHIGNDFPGYSAPQPAQGHNWIEIERNERGSYPIVDANFMPVMCNHCDDAPCMKAATNGAVKKRDDGIVIIDPLKAKGQKQIADACPYGAVSWNEELQLPQAWIFDAHLLDDGWKQTRAEQICPTDVFKSIKRSDAEIQALVEAEGLEVLKPELGTKPRIYYKNLHLMTQCFVGGSVVTQINGVVECVEGAEVVVRKDGNDVGRATTDTFGEFKVDKLEKNSGSYQIEVRGSGGILSQTFEVEGKSPYLGVMKLS
ncbi:MAG: oxidoreductase [Gammaproteobacteria bacterium]|nr:oxidoreductase [Gammaproteobacteria bacterium]